MEIWKVIEDYPNYMVSNMGRVKNYTTNKVLKPHKIENGYQQVFLYKNIKRKMFLLHRLIAQTFIPNPNNLPQVNHKNEDKSDNRVENLEWCSCSYNNSYGTAPKRRKEKLSKSVLQFTKDGEFIKKWDCITDIKNNLGIERSNIYSCCIGKYKTTGGYKWGYADDYERIPFKVFDLEIYRKKVA